MYKFLNNYILLSISPVIFYTLTLNNPYYSDDYGSILGVHLLNKIKDRNFLDILDLGVLRSDGHYNPVMYVIHNLIPPNANIFHFVIVFLFLISLYLTYFFLSKISKNHKLAFISTFFFSVNFSLIIKPLVWNVFHSHITNYFTGIISYIFFYYFIEKKNYVYLFIFILFGILTVFNMESGLIYYVFLPFLLKYFLKTNINFLKIISLSIIPILIYFLFTFYLSQSSEFKTIFEQRIIDNSEITVSKSDVSFKEKLIEYRGRTAPRDIIGYTLRLSENIAASINLSSYEYVYRFFDYNFKNNFYKYFTVIIFLLSSCLYFFSLFQINKKDITYNFKYLVFLYFSTLIFYSIIFFRKDINIIFSLSSAILFSYFILFICKNVIIKSLLIITFLTPSIMYALTGFDEVYEMRSRSYINEMYKDFNSINYQEYDKLNKLHYKQDAIVYYYYKFFDEYSEYLKNTYQDMNMFEFENNLSKDKLIRKIE